MSKPFSPISCNSLDSRHVLIAAVTLVLVLTAANGLFHELSFAVGLGRGSFLPGPQDRFADIVKVALSFKTITSILVDSSVVESWPSLYRDYLLRNPYGDISNLAAGKLTHFHHPPLSQLLFTLASALIVLTGSPTALLWICFAIFAVFVIKLAWRIGKADGNKDVASRIALAFLCLASYPAMLVFLRGNYHAGCTSLLVILFLVDCLGRRQLGIGSLVALAMAINLRPTAIVFVLALPLSIGFARSLRMVFTVGVLAIGVFLVALLVEQAIYPDYNLANFLRGLDIYKERYIFGPGGDGGNASLWALIKNGTTISGTSLDYYSDELSRIFAASSVFVLLVSAQRLLSPNSTAAGIAFILVAIYVLLAPVTAEYHLLVLLAPLLILHARWPETPPRIRSIVFFASVLVLSPKNYFHAEGLSLQTLLNPALLLFALIMIPQQTTRHEDRPESAREKGCPR
jgi:hypothetical protein